MRTMICKLMGMSFLAVSMTAFAQSGEAIKQDTMKQGEQMKHGNMKADDMSIKTVSVSGKVSADGKMFMSDGDNKHWMISNPEAVKGHEGHHVTVKGGTNAAKNEIHVTSIMMGNGAMKDAMKKPQN